MRKERYVISCTALPGLPARQRRSTIAIFEGKQCQHPELPAHLRRTLERRICSSRILNRAPREVIFPQAQEPRSYRRGPADAVRFRIQQPVQRFFDARSDNDRGRARHRQHPSMARRERWESTRSRSPSISGTNAATGLINNVNDNHDLVLRQDWTPTPSTLKWRRQSLLHPQSTPNGSRLPRRQLLVEIGRAHV